MYAEVGAALGDADIDDLYDTIVEDLALRFSIVDPKGGGRSLTAPIPAISFNADDFADCPFALIATGREAETVDRLVRGVPWNNEEADHDPQELSAPETDTARVAKIAGQTRSHLGQKVKAAVLNQADLLRNEMT